METNKGLYHHFVVSTIIKKVCSLVFSPVPSCNSNPFLPPLDNCLPVTGHHLRQTSLHVLMVAAERNLQTGIIPLQQSDHCSNES